MRSDAGGAGLSSGRIIALIVGLVGAAACVVGSVLTWVEIGREFDLGVTNLGGTVTWSGIGYPTDDGARLGQVSLVSGCVGAVTILIAQARGMRWLATLSLGSAVVAGWAAFAFRMAIDSDPATVLDLAVDLTGLVQPGPGPLVVIVGSVMLGVSALVTLISARTSVVLQRSSPQTISSRESAVRNRYGVPVPDLAPNWLPDPTARFEYRFWDGLRWTDRVARAGAESVDPLRGDTQGPWPAPRGPASWQ